MVYNVNDLIRSAALKYLSAPTGPVPVNTVAPVISGTTVTGQTLTVSDGTWSNTPTGFTRQWRRNGSAISGATGASYTLVVADEGSLISATVVATNANGSGSATSSSVGPVTAVPAGPTYAEYQARINLLAADGLRVWDAETSILTGKYRSIATSSTPMGRLWGSPWMTHFTHDSGTARMVQHSLPDAATFAAIQAGGFEVYMDVIDIGTQPVFNAITRNGFTSTAYADYPARRCIDLIYWDGSQAWRMNPFAGTGPTPYTW